ncbi:MAG: FeoA family protein [Gammaproteobacteria bacterium]
MLQLDELPDGVPARVVRLDAVDGLAARMRALGLRPGRELAVVRRSRLGGPLQIRVGTTDFIIRPHDARLVAVEPVDEPDRTGPR